eukprot:922-Rhodomonas_salina.4
MREDRDVAETAVVQDGGRRRGAARECHERDARNGGRAEARARCGERLGVELDRNHRAAPGSGWREALQVGVGRGQHRGVWQAC